MASNIKNQKEILEKLKFEKLNPMQEEAKLAIHSNSHIVLISPTGSGKTVAFLLPIIAELDDSINEIQSIIIVPSRELAIQIEQVAREMGTGYKIDAVYGGRSFSKDKVNLMSKPAILIGTPGRVAAHLRREIFTTDYVTSLVLDEFDKSLEIGFEEEMMEILSLLPNLEKKILTSATYSVEIPDFIELRKPIFVKHGENNSPKIAVKIVNSPDKDKLETLAKLLSHIGDKPGIIFCNFKDSIKRVSDFLKDNGIEHGHFHGNMEQVDRERALIKFRNGTTQLLLATDLAARGIDIPEIKFIIHYHLPHREHEFKHRNGRTARMFNDGIAYVLKWEEDILPDFINSEVIEKIEYSEVPKSTKWATLFISGGRKDKISKGDIAGLFIKQGKLDKDELGIIELKKDCAFVSVDKSKVKKLIETVNNTRLKKKKVRIYKI